MSWFAFAVISLRCITSKVLFPRSRSVHHHHLVASVTGSSYLQALGAVVLAAVVGAAGPLVIAKA